METPKDILIHNELLGLKGGKGVLIRISEDGYYEVNIAFGSNVHRVLLPIETSVIISREAEPDFAPDFEIER